MLKAYYQKLILNFKRPAGTSRGILNEKPGFLITVFDTESPDIKGVGECSVIPGLTPEWSDGYEQKLEWVCHNINLLKDSYHSELVEFPSIRFGVETALLDLATGGKRLLFDTPFSRGSQGITINGLIWMGSKEYMMEQIGQKLSQGFECLKLKIGAIDFEQEIEVLQYIRNRFKADVLELRVDANGAFLPHEAPTKLRRLASLDIHSIEQPIKAGQWSQMAELCANSPLPIALDEELIGIGSYETKRSLLETIKPQYIILKPSLLGGFGASAEWIALANGCGVGWWVTSALESNVGLNAIAQWTSTLNNSLPQGLGTGSLYTNNIPSNLTVKGQKLWLD
jgi:o-succinylbenzoate synthase